MGTGALEAPVPAEPFFSYQNLRASDILYLDLVHGNKIS